MAQLSLSLVLRELQTNNCKINGSLAGNLVGALALIAAGLLPPEPGVKAAFLGCGAFVALCSRASVDSVKRLFILLEEVEGRAYEQAGASIASEFAVPVVATAAVPVPVASLPVRLPTPQPVGEESEAIALQLQPMTVMPPERDFDWIHPFIFGDNNHPPNFHINLIGPTQIGKSTLGEHFMTLQATAAQTAIEAVYLLNPKHKVADPDWSFPPYCDSIDEALQALQDFKLMLKKRQSDPTFTTKTHGLIYFVIDDWDWIFEEYKGKALSELRALIKIGAGLNIRVLLCGQSPLCRDTGLSGSDFKQMGRVILGREAIDFLAGKQFPFAEMKESLYHQAKKLFAANARFALVVPMRTLPFIGQVPDLKKGVLTMPSQPDSPKFSETEIEEVLGWLARQTQPISASDLIKNFPRLTVQTACFLIERASEEGLGKVSGEFPGLVLLPGGDGGGSTNTLHHPEPSLHQDSTTPPLSTGGDSPIPKNWIFPDPFSPPSPLVEGVVIACKCGDYSQTQTILMVWGIEKSGTDPRYQAARECYQRIIQKVA